MVGYFSGYTGVQNINSSIIVFINQSRIFLEKHKLPDHKPQESSSFGGSYIINRICFFENQYIDKFSFRHINNCIPVKRKRKSSSGPHLVRLIFICSVHKTNQFYLINVLLWFGGLFVLYNRMKFGFWTIKLGSSSLVYTPTVSGNTEIPSEVLQSAVLVIRSS